MTVTVAVPITAGRKRVVPMGAVIFMVRACGGRIGILRLLSMLLGLRPGIVPNPHYYIGRHTSDVLNRLGAFDLIRLDASVAFLLENLCRVLRSRHG